MANRLRCGWLVVVALNMNGAVAQINQSKMSIT
jgi:hypothetical protein